MQNVVEYSILGFQNQGPASSYCFVVADFMAGLCCRERELHCGCVALVSRSDLVLGLRTGMRWHFQMALLDVRI